MNADLIVRLPHDSDKIHLIVIFFIVIALCVVIIGMARSFKKSNIIKDKIDKMPLKVKRNFKIAFYMKHPVILYGFFLVLLSIGLWVMIKEGFTSVKCTPDQIILDYRILSDVSFKWNYIQDVNLSRTGKFGRNIAIEITTIDGKPCRSVVRNRKRDGDLFEQSYKNIVEYRNNVILSKNLPVGQSQ